MSKNIMEIKNSYLETAIKREILKENKIVYFYDTLFLNKIYNIISKESTAQEDYFKIYTQNLSDITIRDFSSLPQKFRLELFELEIMHPRNSIKNILFESNIHINEYVKILKEKNETNIELYIHFATKFKRAVRKRKRCHSNALCGVIVISLLKPLFF